jgi:hypothetical protein
MMRTYTGLLALRDVGEGYEALFVSDHLEPLAEELHWIKGKNVTIRYWLTNTKCTKDEAITHVLHKLDGISNADFGANYSETTGYLWTDEKLNVGGHNLLNELKTHLGKWLILEVDY